METGENWEARRAAAQEALQKGEKAKEVILQIMHEAGV